MIRCYPTGFLCIVATTVAFLLSSCSADTQNQNVLPSSGVATVAQRTVSRLPLWPSESPAGRPSFVQPSWIAPDAQHKDLLYVSDSGNAEVDIYSYPAGELEGQLTGFSSTGGLCSDDAGNVFVTDGATSTIIEYAHGATTSSRTLHDRANAHPNSCTIDPTTGDLAVTNIGRPPQTQKRGSIDIYSHASGHPRKLRGPFHPYSAGYDPQGNLFIDGESADFQDFRFGEIPHGSHTFVPITVDTHFIRAGGVQWDSSAMAVADAENAAIYRLSIDGRHANTIQTISLDGLSVSWQFVNHGGRVSASNAIPSSNGNISLYRYPAGGAALKTIGAFTNPSGVTISVTR